MKKIIRWFMCHVMNDHTWTCKAEEGIKPNESEMTIEGFKSYAKMYCKHCRKESALNARLK